MRNIKVVVVGDGGIGKTSLLISYTTNTFPKDYIPTVFDNYSTTLIIDGKPVKLGLWDTAGQSEYDKLRPLSYPQTDVFLCCFSVVDPVSLQNIKDKWVPEVRRHTNKQIIIILIGTKIDIRDDPNVLNELYDEKMSPITFEDGMNMKKALNLNSYMECSAANLEGLNEIFERVFHSVTNKEKNFQTSNKNIVKKGRSISGFSRIKKNIFKSEKCVFS